MDLCAQVIRRVLRFGFITPLVFVVVSAAARPAFASVLSDYVATPDSAYSYAPVSVTAGNGYQLHTLQMTSQQWPRSGESRTTWKHGMVIVVPNTTMSSTAMLLIGEGSNGNPLLVPRSNTDLAIQIALATRSVVAVVAQVPNQPLFFDNDNATPYFEDKLVAFSWDRAMDTGDYTWAVYLPMVKAAVRALDTVQSYLPTAAGIAPIGDFVVIGFSKRGAATWLTAAVDDRVRAFVPGVFDVLNMAPQFEHHFSAYGFYAPAVEEYVDFDIVRRVRTPEGTKLLEVVDPYSYRAVLTKPKFLLNSTGDQFFLPDSARFYLKHLSGETQIRYVPNTSHGLSTSTGGIQDALVSLVGWYQSVLLNSARPVIQWRQTTTGITVTVSRTPIAVRLWRASNALARDFRKEAIGEAWTSTDLSVTADGIYTISLDSPPQGWQASFVEFVFPGPAGVPQTYSTRIFITPDALPFSVSDPINDPQSDRFWQQQITAAADDPDSSNPIRAYFPFPVFGRYITSVDAAKDVFATPGSAAEALEECISTRLNIASGQLGWYSPVVSHDKTRPLWRVWEDANRAFQLDRPARAKELCQGLNAL